VTSMWCTESSSVHAGALGQSLSVMLGTFQCISLDFVATPLCSAVYRNDDIKVGTHGLHTDLYNVIMCASSRVVTGDWGHSMLSARHAVVRTGASANMDEV